MKPKIEARDWVKIPNLITLSGIAAAALYVYSFLTGNAGLLVGTFAWSAVSDFLDGRIARYLGQETGLGRMLDPIHDRLLLLAVLINFVWIEGFVARPWMIALVALLLSELAIGAIGLAVHLKGKRVTVASIGRARQVGHIFLTSFWILGSYFHPEFKFISFEATMSLMAILSFATLFFYFGRAWTMWNEKQ